MFKHLKYLVTLLVFTQFFVLTFTAQLTYGLDKKDIYNPYFKSGISKFLLGDNRGTIQDFNKAIELNPKFTGAFTGRGIAKARLKDYRGAAQDLSKAIELNPKHADAYRVRGNAKIYLGQKDSGCLDLSKAGELSSSEAVDLIKEHCN